VLLQAARTPHGRAAQRRTVSLEKSTPLVFRRVDALCEGM
jgi:hypothetical protein